MGNLYQRLDAEEQALHDSWDSIARVTLVVMLMSTLVWSACAALRWGVHASTDHLFGLIEAAPASGAARFLPWALLLGALVASGLIRAFLVRRPGWSEAVGDGLEVARDNYHCTYQDDGDDPRPRFQRPAFGLALRKMVTTGLTLGAGGSGGLEAPVVVVGESIGAGCARVFSARSEHELRTYQLAGIAAAVSTLLGAPFAAALFAIEFAYGDRIIYRKLAYALLAGLVAYTLNHRFVGVEPLFVASAHQRSYALGEYLATAVVAVAVSAPVALAFGLAMRQTGEFVARFGQPIRGAAAGLATGLVALALHEVAEVGPRHVLGMGEATISALLAPGASFSLGFLALAIVGKMVTTGLTVRSGGSAGLLIPSMFLGGTSGALTAKALLGLGLATHLDPSLFVVVGIASALVAVVGVPLAAIALVLEVFGAAYGPPAFLACGVTHVLTTRLRMPRAKPGD